MIALRTYRHGSGVAPIRIRPLLVLLLLLSATAATAQPGSDPVVQLDEAMNAYDELELDRASAILDAAIEEAANVGNDDPVVAGLYIMRGVVEYALAGGEPAVIAFFTEGLLVDRAADINPYYTNPDLNALLQQAREALPEPDVSGPPPNSLTHSPAVTVRAGRPIMIDAEVDRRADVERVVLYYRPYAANRFIAEYLEIQTPTRFSGVVPGEATATGIQIEYYLEALGTGGDVLGYSGSSATPNVVVILEAGGDTPPDGEVRERIMGATLGVGTGGGLATGEPVVMGSEVDLNPGIALTPLHFYADLTFELAQSIEFGVFTRLQLVLLEDGTDLEPMVGGKLKWFFNDIVPPLMYASAGFGYGYVRHTVDLSPTIDFVDTTREGPWHVGAGFGIVFLFSEHVGIVTDLYAMVLFDVVSVQLDLNLGLYLTF